MQDDRQTGMTSKFRVHFTGFEQRAHDDLQRETNGV
jgi:hypothetical protein